MNAVMLLKADHRTVEALFKKYEKLGDVADKQKKQLATKIIRELSIHAQIEEQVFYPAIRKAVPRTEDMVLEALEEHHIVKWTLAELAKMSPEEERFDAKMTVLMEGVRHHVKEEEGDLFPMVQKKLDAKTLMALGQAMEKAKKVVPTRPHPRAPDTPPGNVIAGLPTALVDRALDAGKKLAKKIAGRGSAKPNGHAAPARRGQAASGRSQHH